jgi:predicted urease superfamily metal-dependent hydrolase
MKPELQKIFTKLSEEKLEKVELNIVSELKDLRKELDRGIDVLMQYATDAREAIGKGKREMDRLDSVYKVSQRILSDAMKSAKELGVEIPEIKELNKMISAYEQQKKSLSQVLK